MSRKKALVILSSALAIGGTVAGTAAADPTTDQTRLADTTLKLEKTFSDQFVQGHIDRDALAAPIADVIQAVPESARPRVQAHIDAVVAQGEKLTSTLTPEQRAQAAEPPDAEHVSKTEQAQVAAWGWPGFAGWGGYGAFGFPAYGCGFGLGYGTAYGLGYGTAYGLGYYGIGFGVPYGLGWGGFW